MKLATFTRPKLGSGYPSDPNTANGSIPTLIQCLVGAMALLDFHGKRQKIVWLKQCRRSCL